ncbi:RNA-binding protein 45-like [Danaus plexippus]|nr:RNA-binding protein 45-like [Danaus plexippus]
MSMITAIRNNDRKEEKPPHSRVFVVCNKQLKEEDLRLRFQRFGAIEDLYIPRDRHTGESKGVAYIKYAKTSSAAAAIQEVHMKVLNNDNKPTKVMVAVNKNENPAQNENVDRYRRLFIKVQKDASESELRHHFSTFGQIESIHLQRDKVTDTCKGFAYVQYKTFYDAAKAFEECDKKYRPVFATPRDDLKRSRNCLDIEHHNINGYSNTKNNHNHYTDRHGQLKPEYNNENMNGTITCSSYDYNTISVKCSPQVAKKYIEQLFNVIPGMVQFQYYLDTFNGISKAVITYEESRSAAHAVDRLNKFEFPSGEILTVKPDKNPLVKAANDLTDIVNNFRNAVDYGAPDIKQLAEAIAKASTLIKASTTGQIYSPRDQHDYNYCDVILPPHKPMADNNSRVAQRLFIICKPQPPPMSTLQDVFCRFGDLINVSTIPNKTFGFVKYASVNAAQEAMRVLNGATVTGVKLKVLEADEKPNKEDKVGQTEQAENTDYDMDSKRMRLDDKD